MNYPPEFIQAVMAAYPHNTDVHRWLSEKDKHRRVTMALYTLSRWVPDPRSIKARAKGRPAEEVLAEILVEVDVYVHRLDLHDWAIRLGEEQGE